jgi:fructose-1,6-bisphosphatase II / sedoheptulose-1,7-bisphosphatase
MKQKNIEFELVKSTIAAAVASYHFIGLGREKDADQAAVDSMRLELMKIDFAGKIVIGEGERDEAPMLYIGEELGKSDSPKMDIAVDPLEGTTLTAQAMRGAISVAAFTSEGGLLNAPDTYMEKIAIGFDFNEQLVDLNLDPKENLLNISKALKISISDLIVTILDRPRHAELISKIRHTGAKVQLISDGDVSAVISTTKNYNNIYMGSGGAPEGVLAAAALKTLGGQMATKLIVRNTEEKARCNKLGIFDFDKQYLLNDLVKTNDVIFCASGVTDGDLLDGVKKLNSKIITHSMILKSLEKCQLFLQTYQPNSFYEK